MSAFYRRAVAITGTSALTLVLAACGSDGDSGSGTTLTISANAIVGGKNTEEAEWIEEYVIPEFEAAKEAEGVDVNVEFVPSGLDDEDYKSQLALDLQSGSGPDIFGLDGIWVGEFAQAGYVEPLNDSLTAAEFWEGWEEIPDAVQKLVYFEGQRYGIPNGTDARVLFYNKDLFEQAGLDREWQPTSWDELIEAAEALGTLDNVIPVQLNAGTAMGEATTMQGLLPFLAGAGEEIWIRNQWTGNSDGMVRTLELYEQIYGNDLGDPLLQQETSGRDKSFEQFAAGEIGILAEGDYFWRSVLHPEVGVAPMEDRDETVGYALIPAVEPGAGIEGQDFVSMSGGSARVMNPETDDKELAFDLLTFMASKDAVLAHLEGADPRITARTDVNEELLSDDPMLTFINEEVLPLTTYRPGVAEYPEVSLLIQEATSAIISGDSPTEAAANYESKLEEVVGGAGNVTP